MSNSRSPKTPSATKALPPVNIAVTGTVCKILKNESQPARSKTLFLAGVPVHAVLLSFTTNDTRGEPNSFIGMLRRKDIVGLNEYAPGVADEQAQARLDSLKIGDTLSVMTTKATFGRHYPLIDLSERAILKSVQELLVGKEMEGVVSFKDTSSLTVAFGGGLKGRLLTTSLAGDCQFGRFVSIKPGQSIAVKVIGVEPDLSKVGQFHLILAETSPLSVAA
jgi:hypothetical protein